MLPLQHPTPDTIGHRLKQARIDAGLTMGQVVRIGRLYDTAHYSKIENYTNGQLPSTRTILKLSKALPRMNIHWLMTGQGRPDF